MRLPGARPPVDFRPPSWQEVSWKQPFTYLHVSVLVPPVLLLMFCAPSAFAESRHQAGANLRLSVNVIAVVFPAPQIHEVTGRWAYSAPGLSEGIRVDVSAGRILLSWAEEVKKLSETGWAAGYSAVSQLPSQTTAEIGGRVILPPSIESRELARPSAGPAPEDGSAPQEDSHRSSQALNEAVVRTCIVVPE
ncbi:MAG: hypothetical protein ABSB82_04440 [Terriglobia bacterium]